MPTSLQQIQILAGVEPSTDRPESSTSHYTFTKAIRFQDGFPEKIGGWVSLDFNSGTIQGSSRSLFSYVLNGYTRYLVGTNSNLYDIFGTQLTNITPVKAATIAIADSLDTYYNTLGADPIATVDGSTTITITDTAHKFQAGDTVTLSGSTAVNGIPAGDINADQFIRSVTTNTYDIIVSTAATSTGSGGGASVVRSSGIITVNATAHGLSDGDRVKIASAADTAGITAAQINLEHIIRNSVTNAFDIVTAGTATSSVTGGGGASTTYQEPIDEGASDVLQGQGYGVGLYGVGLYGVSKVSTSTSPPRIWSHDRFGDLVLSTPGEQGDVYQWDGDILVAPVKVTNSPPANYVFVSNNIVVVLGYDSANTSQEDNGISWSDQGGVTAWSSGQAGSDVIEGAGKFLTHASARGENLLFTQNQTYTFRYIGGQFIWQTRILDSSIGIIGQNARASALGTIYWMGTDNFYMWRGGNVEVIPSNSGTQCTALQYVFDDINFGQKEKVFCWYNQEFQEIWWHYPSSSSNEPDRIIRVNVERFDWVIDQLDRTAAEYPSILSQTPYLIDSSNTVYLHENGVNDDESALSWEYSGPMQYQGTNLIRISGFVPDNSMSGTATVQITTKRYPGENNYNSRTYSIGNSTGRVGTQINGRYIKYKVSGNELDQSYMGGVWYHEMEPESPK